MTRFTTTHILIVGLLFLAAGLGYNYLFRPFEKIYALRQAQEQQAAQMAVLPSPVPSGPPSRAELVAAAHDVLVWPVVVEASPTASQSAAAQVAELRPVWVTLFGSNVSTRSAQAAVAELKRGSAEPWIWVDHEGGKVQRLAGSGFTRLPSWQEQCQLTASASAQLVGKAARELAAVGVDGVFGPVVDLDGPGFLGTRTCSDDPAVVAKQAGSWMSLMREQNVQPVLKHFPGVGSAQRDLHTSFDRVTVTPEQAGVYRSLLQSFADTAVMVSHAGVVNQYPDIPCSLSAACVGELGTAFPNVLIVSDALEMTAAGFQGEGVPTLSLADRAIKALKAGNHVLVFGPEVTVAQLLTVEAQLVQVAQYDQALAEALMNGSQQTRKYLEINP